MSDKQNKTETKRFETLEQFEKETGLKPTQDVWKPINTTSAKLTELKDQIKDLGESQKIKKTIEFIEANKTPDVISGVTAQVGTVAVTAGAGAEIGGLLKDATGEALSEIKKPGFWKGKMGDFMKDALEGMLEAKKEGGVMGFLAGLGLMFLKPFAGKLGLSPEQLKELGIDTPSTTPSGTTPPPIVPEAPRTQLEQGGKDSVVELTAGYFLRKTHDRKYDNLWSAVWEGTKDAWNKDEVQAKKTIEKEAKLILNWKGLSGKTYSEIIQYKDDPDIATKLGLTGLNPKIQIPALRLAVKALAINETHIQELIGAKHGNWRELPLHTFLENFYAYTGMATVTKVANMVKDIDFKDPGKYAEAIRRLAITPNSDGSLGGYVGERLSTYKSQGIDEEVVRRIVVPGTQGEQTVENFRSTLVNDKFENSLAQDKMTELTQKDGFSKSVVGLMNSVGLDQYTSGLKEGEELTMEELLMVYVITGGQKDIKSLSQGQLNEIIPVLYGIAARKNPGAFTLNAPIDFFNSPTNGYVQKMADFVGTAMSDAAYIATFQSLGIALESAQALLELRSNPDPEKAKYFWYIMGAIGLGLGSIIFLRKPVLSVFLTFGLLSLIAKGAGLTLVSK